MGALALVDAQTLVPAMTLLPVAWVAGAAGGWAWDALGRHAFLCLSLGAALMSELSLVVLLGLCQPTPSISPESP